MSPELNLEIVISQYTGIFIILLLTGFREFFTAWTFKAEGFANRFLVKGNIFCGNRIISVRLIKYYFYGFFIWQISCEI